MNSRNCAYSKEYDKHQNEFEYIFCDDYFVDEVYYSFDNSKYQVVVKEYLDDSKKYHNYSMDCYLITIKDNTSNRELEFKGIGTRNSLVEFIEHSDGNKYILFKINLYGYSVMNLASFEYSHYIPSGSFDEGKETFIVAGVEYNSKDNYLVIEGCYWAHPYGLVVLDFTHPLELPPKVVFNYEEHTEILELSNEVEFDSWNSDSKIIIKNCDDKDKVHSYLVDLKDGSIEG